jgi:hypothetical protein
LCMGFVRDSDFGFCGHQAPHRVWNVNRTSGALPRKRRSRHGSTTARRYSEVRLASSTDLFHAGG